MYSNMLGLRLQLNKKYIIFVSLDKVRHMLCLWAAFKIAKQNRKTLPNASQIGITCTKHSSNKFMLMPVVRIAQSIWHFCHDICELCDIQDVSLLYEQVPHSEGCCCSSDCQPRTGEALCSPHIKFVKAKEGGKWMMSRSFAALSAHLWHFHLWLKRFQLLL